MAVFVQTDCRLWLDGHDYSGKSNALAVTYGAEMQDDTVYGDDTRSRAGGLKTVLAEAEGFVDYSPDATNIDEVVFGRVGTADTIMTFAPTGTEGDKAFGFEANIGTYEVGGVLGELAPFSLSAEGSGGVDGLVEGTILANGTKTTTADGTGFQVGAVSASQFVYAHMHVFSVSASDTLDVVIESDATDAWSGAETTRFTFSQATASNTVQWASRVAGAITDPWWRATWTIGGSDTSMQFAVVLGIK